MQSNSPLAPEQLQILGYSNLAVSHEVLIDGYRTMVKRAVSGDLVLEVAQVALEDFAEAWAGTEAGGSKYAVVP